MACPKAALQGSAVIKQEGETQPQLSSSSPQTQTFAHLLQQAWLVAPSKRGGQAAGQRGGPWKTAPFLINRLAAASQQNHSAGPAKNLVHILHSLW